MANTVNNHSAHQGHGTHGSHSAHNSGSHGGSSHGGTLKSYVIGFVLSIVLTIIPLAAVMGGMFDRTMTIVVILATAVLQFAVQLLFFMHLREGENARWNIMALLMGVLIMVTIVGGSIWIMAYNTVAH